MDKLEIFANQINNVLIRRGIVSAPLKWGGVAGPEWMGEKCYALVVDLSSFTGKRLELLHHTDVLADISTHLGGIKVNYANHQGLAYIIKDEKVLELSPVILLDELKRINCYLIVGGRGTGKTTLLQHIVTGYDGTVIIIDPKPRGENNWQRGLSIGHGFNWAEIETKTAELVAWMDYRLRHGYKKSALIVIDEFYRLIRHNPVIASRVFDDLLVSGRTAGIDVVCGTHSERVKGLGIDGIGDLIENFDAIVRLSKVRGTYKATIDYGEGQIPARPPAPFLSELDRIITRLAIEQNEGICSVRSITELIAKHPAITRNYGNEFTYHKLQKRFSDWESKGWLLPSVRNPETGLLSGRKISQILLDLLGGG